MLVRLKPWLWVTAATGLLLLIPLIAMQFTSEVSWGAGDFAMMGLLLFLTGSAYILLSRQLPRNRKLIMGAFLVCGFLLVWTELAVGLFTNPGS